jgi:hypothetical protein
MLPIIGLEMESRGRDAWGASDGNEVIRHVGPLHETWYEDYDHFHEWKAGIFHTRGASTGSPKELENAHPFTYEKSDGTKVIGIHNGVVSNHKELDSKYGRNFSVDSMHLWKSRAEGRKWDDIEGWGNLAWWETTLSEEGHQERNLHLARFNNSALELFRLEGGELIFASTQAPVRVAAKMMGNPVKSYLHLDEYTHYYIREGENNAVTLWKSDVLPFPRPQVLRGGNHYTGMSIRNTISSCSNSVGTGDWCIVCGSIRIDHSEHLICPACFYQMILSFEKEMKHGARQFAL